MSCPSAVTHSMYADGALSPRESALLWRHAATCDACRARIEALKQETTLLRTALKESDDLASIPRFVPPARPRDFVVLTLAVLAIGGFSKAFWSTVGAAIPSSLRWLNPLDPGALIDRAYDAITFVIYEGTAMWTAMMNIAGAALVLAFAAWLALSATRRVGFGAAAASLLAVVIALPSIGHAFERRHSEGLVTVAAGETIDDTLFAAGDTVSIDGTVTGDLLAFGRSVTVRGNVGGNLIAGADTVRIEGTVGGSVIGGARALSLENAVVGRDLYGFANNVGLGPDSSIAGNATAFAESIDIDGGVGVDFNGFAATISVSGTVEGDVEGHARTINVLPSARIGGNVTGHVDSPGDLNFAPGAIVGGTVDEQLVDREQRRNRYATVGYYVNQIVRLGAAFLSGLLLLWVFPVLRDVSLPDVMSVLRSGAIGLAAAVTVPVAAVILCVTIVGLPLGVLTFLLGAIGLYFSKTVVAQVIGRAVLRNPAGAPHFAATLIVGLVIVIVAINLPFVGGVVNLVLTLVGFGILVSLLLARLNRGSVA